MIINHFHGLRAAYDLRRECQNGLHMADRVGHLKRITRFRLDKHETIYTNPRSPNLGSTDKHTLQDSEWVRLRQGCRDQGEARSGGRVEDLENREHRSGSLQDGITHNHGRPAIAPHCIC